MDKTAFFNVVKENNSFIVTSHISPDGDSLGSTLAMTRALSKLGKKAIPVVNDHIPKKYNFLPGIDMIKSAEKCAYGVDVIISLDCGDKQRLGFDKELSEYGRKIINIDHHKSNLYFGDLNIVNSDASSVGEILYQLLKEKVDIDYEIALCLYTSIITDTGSIRYSNTTPLTLKILANLVEKGVKPDYVSRQVFEKRSLESIELLKCALNTLEVVEKGKVACIYVTEEMFETSGAKEEDADGIINYAREIEGVEVALFFRQQTDCVKVGFRSNDWVDVRKIAETFGGGGHIRAAGCTLNVSLGEAKTKVLGTVKEFLMEDPIERNN